LEKITIRALTDEDVEAYKEIRLEMLQDKPEAFGDSYENTKDQDLDFYLHRINNGSIFAAFLENKIVATTGYFIKQGIRSDHKAYIWGVYVQPKHRGNGLSHRLLEYVLKNLPPSVTVAQLAYTKGNISAEKTYKKAGFKEWGIEEKAIKVDNQFYDEIHMVKFLDK